MCRSRRADAKLGSVCGEHRQHTHSLRRRNDDLTRLVFANPTVKLALVDLQMSGLHGGLRLVELARYRPDLDVLPEAPRFFDGTLHDKPVRIAVLAVTTPAGIQTVRFSNASTRQTWVPSTATSSSGSSSGCPNP